VSEAVAKRRPPRRRTPARRRRRAALTAGVAVAALAGVLVGLHETTSAPASPGAARRAVASRVLAPGTVAPPATFTTLAGRTESLAALRGEPVLLWLVTTWCPSCQAGTRELARHLEALRADGVRVVELENYGDLGASGPSMATFSADLAGRAVDDPDWTFGQASWGLTRTYNPQAFLDVYYLIDARGRIAYVNGSPASTMPELLAAAKALP